MKAADAWRFASERPILVAAALCLLPPLTPLLVVLSPLLLCVALALGVLPHRQLRAKAVDLDFTAPSEISRKSPRQSRSSLARVSPITAEEKYSITQEPAAASAEAKTADDQAGTALEDARQRLAQNQVEPKKVTEAAAVPRATAGTDAAAAAPAAGGAAILARLRCAFASRLSHLAWGPSWHAGLSHTTPP